MELHDDFSYFIQFFGGWGGKKEGVFLREKEFP